MGVGVAADPHCRPPLRSGTLAGVTLLRSCDRSQRVCTLCLPWGRWVHVRPDDFPRRARSSWPGAGFRRALPVRTGFGQWRCAGGCNLCPLPWPGSPGQDCRMIACPIRPPFGVLTRPFPRDAGKGADFVRNMSIRMHRPAPCGSLPTGSDAAGSPDARYSVEILPGFRPGGAPSVMPEQPRALVPGWFANMR